MCTNRFSALDPAVRRRAADIMTFARPNDEQRRHVLSLRLEPLGVSPSQVRVLVGATGPKKGAPIFRYLPELRRVDVPSKLHGRSTIDVI